MSVSTLGIAILSVAFAMSLIYIVHDRALKSRKTLSLLERLPSLERCDRVGLQSLAAGFLLLTLGIGTGIAVNFDVFQQWWVFGIKQIFPVVAWLMFAGILGARTALGFRGRKSAYATMAGFAIVLLSVLGMTL